MLKTEGCEIKKGGGEKTWERLKKKKKARRTQQVPCWQRRGSESSAAEHFDKSCSSGRMWTEVVFHWDGQDVI